MAIQTLFYIGLGVVPALIWLLFYLQEDAHPEPKTLLLQVFFLGMAAAFVAQKSEEGIIKFIEAIQYISLPVILIIVAVAEEILKFLVVRIRVLSDPDFDEPVDAMIYMVVSALGFAALENIFYLFNPINATAADSLTTALARFVSATLFHALASGIVGFWLAKAVFAKRRHWSFVSFGLTIAIGFHILFNLFMVSKNIVAVGILLLFMAVLLAKAFDTLRKTTAPLATKLSKQTINF